MNIKNLTLDPKNANRGTDRGRKALTKSLELYGAGRSILVDKKGRVIAGNKTLEQAIASGHKDVIVVKSDGKKLIAVQRTDLDLKDKRAKALAIADNRTAELDLDWNPEVLAELGKEIDLTEVMWSQEEMDQALGDFKAATLDEQGRLDEKTPVECPSCGHKFTP
jgi:ParB family chromosome partitioning protein